MRVLVTINGKKSVHEILEFEPQEDGSILITTHEDCVDLIVTNMNEARMEAVLKQLLRDGYVDISEYETVYDDICEDWDDDEEYNAICPCCHEPFNFRLTPTVAALGEVICPYCGEELEFDLCNEEGTMLRLVPEDEEDVDDEALEYEATCPQCHMTVEVKKADVEAGGMICPICKANLEFDAIDAENQTLGDYDDEEDDE